MVGTEGVELLSRAHTYLSEVVAAVPEQAWGARTPCSEWTVRQVVNHARLDQQAYGAVVTGHGLPDSDPFQPADALHGDAPAELDAVLAGVREVYGGLAADDAQVPTPLGPLPFRLAAAAAAMDAAVHAWDIAVATGQDAPLAEDVAEGIRPVATALVDRLRDAYGVFAPAREVAADEGRAAALLAFLGRDPHWTPAAP
jgi:uncharacterized protein (TIGR03086 family)